MRPEPARILALLRQVDGFATLSTAVLKRIITDAEIQEIDRGAQLITEGDPADNLYIVLSGRFVVLAGQTPIAEIAAGEPIGELAFFAGGTRTASVQAERASSVLSLSRAAYQRLAAEIPALANAVLAALSRRLVRAVPSAPKLRPRAGTVTCLVPGGGQRLPHDFVRGLRDALGQITLLSGADIPHGQTPGSWIENHEVEADQLVLVVNDPETEPEWCAAALATSDTVVIALDRQGTPPLAPSALEQKVAAETLDTNVHLALIHAPEQSTRNTAAWLAGRRAAVHHHVERGNQADLERLGRFILGQATGLVLCGGGSFGTAHLAAVKAMREHGHTFDYYGGTSVGSAMAAALATGLDPDHAMDLCDAFFVRSKVMSRYTVPRYGFLDHHALDDALRGHYGDTQVEDARVNFFAVATSLTHNTSRVLRRGPIWKVIRASSSIPGVFPPVTFEDREVLIDGGLIDNVPLGVMREMKPGFNVVLNFTAGPPWRSRAPYEALPTRGQAVWRMLTRKHGPKHPKIFNVMGRSMVVNARKLLAETEIGGDVLINMQGLRGMSFLDWRRGRELFEAAYRRTADALEQADGEGLAHIRNAADIINLEPG